MRKKGGFMTKTNSQLPIWKLIILGIQHVFTMFGATILVPRLTGLDVSVSLFMAGCGTLLFHVVTKGKVPAFLGSSFAFLAPIASSMTIAKEKATSLGLSLDSVEGKDYVTSYAGGGLVVAGLVYLALAGFIALFGEDRVLKYFPPIITGPIIIVIGLNLAGTAISMAGLDGGKNYPMAWLAVITFIVVSGVSIYAKGFLKVLPVMIGLIVGYTVSVLSNNVDFAPVVDAFNKTPFALPHFVVAKFDLSIIMITAPVALATMVEHIGDIIAIGETTGQNYAKDPGLHRTLVGDGLATSLSAMFGGPANTTYSENTGVLALTKRHNPIIMRIAAVFAILLGLMPPVSALIESIPTAVIGGISIVLFGMIASVGLRTLVEHKVNLNCSRNLIIASVILVLGLGRSMLNVTISGIDFKFGGLALASIIGIVLNIVLKPATEGAED